MQLQEAVADRWLNAILRTYPSQTARFFVTSKDPLRNPVGIAFKESLTTLITELFHGMDADRVSSALERVVAIRAVHDFSPRQALAFIFELKEILREECPGPALEVYLPRIDEMALTAFDLYVKCREKICELRASEDRRRVYVLERKLAAGAKQERGEN